MRFVIGSTEDAAQYIAERLRTLLASGKSVLWLVSGGSNIPIQIAAMEMVPDSLSKQLAIIPVDERYGQYNHAESNSYQMREAGFSPKHAECVDILEENMSPQATAKLLDDYLARGITMGDYIFATLGMGTDGRIAGILPHSPAITSSDLALCYKAPDFQRITLCADTITNHCDEVVLSAFDQTKKKALHALAGHEDLRQSSPAVLLKEITNCTVYNDEIEGEIV